MLSYLIKFNGDFLTVQNINDGKILEQLSQKYVSVSAFCEGRAMVENGYKSIGFVDRNGVEKVPLIYHDACDFSEGAALVQKDSLWGFVDLEGVEFIPTQYKYAASFENGLAEVGNGENDWGFIDKSGNWYPSRDLGYAALQKRESSASAKKGVFLPPFVGRIKEEGKQ